MAVDNKKIDDITDTLRNAYEIAENSLEVQKNLLLASNVNIADDTPKAYDTWKQKIKIEREKLKESINNSAKVIKNTLHSIDKNISKEIRVNIETDIDKPVLLMSQKVMKDFDRDVAKVFKLKNYMPLYDAILKQTQEGIENGIKIVYKNGREYTFKSYMEMRVRTDIRHEINDNLFKTSANNGIVFYICNSFGDCAEDHAKFQGKYYYDTNWKSFGYDKETSKKIEDTIRKYKMLSIQEVTQDKPYLTTRPNCRHVLEPITLNEAIDQSPKEVGDKLRINKGTYNTKEEKLRQQQRYNERMIRKYKTRYEQNKLLYDEMPTASLKTQLKKDANLIKAWNKKQYNFCNKYHLKRDTRRESQKVLVQDLGVGYSLGLKVNGKNMTWKKPK